MILRNFALCFLTTLTLAQSTEIESAESAYLFSVSRNQRERIGYEASSFSSAELFAIPYATERFIPFIDGRLHCFDRNGQLGFNVGGGFRVPVPNFDSFLGINTYYDQARWHHHNFEQVGVGVEAAFQNWNLRCNGYIPVGDSKKRISFCRYDGYEGGYFIERRKYFSVLKGVDFEAESKIFDNSDTMEIYLAIGGYYYKRQRCQLDIIGASLRATSYLYDQWTLAVAFSHDAAFNSRVYAELTYTIPLKGTNITDARLLRAPVRQEPLIFNRESLWRYNW